MKFVETRLKGAYIIELEPIEDERGFFARTFCQEEFEEFGLNPNVVQCNISYNKLKGTLRGLHYQSKPYEEDKLVQCFKGSILDVIVDIRSESTTFKKWISVELTETNKKMLYVPQGFAHGFLTLTNNVVVYYQMSEFYHKDYSRGIRWNDPILNIEWPVREPIISKKDNMLPTFEAL